MTYVPTLDVFIMGHTPGNYHVWCYFQQGASFIRATDVTVTVDQPIEQVIYVASHGPSHAMHKDVATHDMHHVFVSYIACHHVVYRLLYIPYPHVIISTDRPR